MIVVLATTDRWICFNRESVHCAKPYTSMDEAACLVSLSPHVTGEITLKGDKSHAPALIERSELARGSIEPESQVFVHSVHAVDTTYQAAYSVAPLAHWLEVAAWAKNQSHQCVITSVHALAWNLVRQGQSVLIQDGLTFTFWALVRNRIIHCSLVAMGSQAEDTYFTAAALGQRVAALSELGQNDATKEAKALSVKWLSTLRSDDEQGHEAALRAFENAAGLKVESADSAYDTCSDLGVIASALPALAFDAPEQAIIGPPGARLLFRAEKLLPVFSVLCLLTSTGVLGLAIYWLAQASQIGEAAQLKRSELSKESTTLLAFAKKAGSNPELDAQLAFSASMRQLQKGYDVEHALRALKISVRGGMRILGVRSLSEPESKTATPAVPARVAPRTFIVDGVLPDSSGQDVLLLSEFIRSLNNSGYMAEAIEVTTSAAGSSSSLRLFSYRVYPSAPR